MATFNLDTSSDFYSKEGAESLQKIRFKFKPFDDRLFKERPDDSLTIEIDTLEQLLSFVQEYGTIIIDRDSTGRLELEIYDGYRE